MAGNGNGSSPNKIFLWSNARCLSTSFEKCVGFMDGAQIWHEPYAMCNMNVLFDSPEIHEKFPGMKAFARQFFSAQRLIEEGGHLYQGGNLLPAKLFNRDWVKEQLEKPIEEGKNFMFVKEVAFCIDGFYDKIPQVKVKHTFLIRHPHRIALSMRRLLSHLMGFEGNEEDFDVGSGNPFMAWEKLSPDPLFKLWNYVRENFDPNPIVIDADDLQNHPEQILRKYCEAVGIPFKKKYLKWDKSDESLRYFHGCLEHLAWGKKEGVYDAAFLSSCFLPLKGPVPEIIPDNCIVYAKEFLEGYKVMYESRIKPE